MIDPNTVAARDFFKAVRAFSENTKPWQPQISYQTLPDEVFDLSLVSQRVYGRRDEYLTILAAAGLSSFDMPLAQKRLVLPNEEQLYAIKRRTGFESIAAHRENGVPTWV